MRPVLNDEFRSVFEQVGVGMAFTGLDDKFVRVNRKFAEMLGYAVEELGQLGPVEITAPEHRAARAQRTRALLNGASREVVSEKQLIRKNGTLVWVSVVTSLVRQDDGEPLYFMSVVQDISARRATEQALRESEQRMQSVFRSAPVGIGVVVNRVFTQANQRLCAMTGYQEA
ncbi:MAG: PAS domain-containing protein, partial [Burkholderiales bacterium]